MTRGLFDASAIWKAGRARTVVRDVEVRDGQGILVAIVRGNAWRTRGSVAATEGEPPCA